MSDTIKLTIDGKEIEVEKGTSVLTAAGRLGLDVPRYCYHPGLTVAGNCRICLVEIEKMPKLATSCTTTAAEGMVVRTSGAKVEDGRRAVMEFLLANHPLDCPICDQAGECRLQEYSFEHGSGVSRFREERLKGIKQTPIGPHVVLDTERCIVCTRCVRFCDEVTHTGELGVFQRGVRSMIGTFPGQQLDNLYSGNTVDICPVGALTLEEFRFKKRVWELKNVSSVCGTCARGCNVNLGTADNKIWRLTPRENQAVNRWWMCDEGRLSYQTLDTTPRLTSARIRKEGRTDSIPWPEALDTLAARLRQARPGTTGVIASAGMTLEDLYMVKRLFGEMLPQTRIVVPGRFLGKDDEILIRADKNPNAAGARLVGLTLDDDRRQLSALLADAAAGKLELLLVLGEEGLDLSEAGKQTFLTVFSPFISAAVEQADLALPAAAYGEFDGTWVNFQGRAQKVRRGVTPQAIALEGWQVMTELMRRLGAVVPHKSSADVLAEFAATSPKLAVLTPRAIGPNGVQVPA